MRRQVVYDDLIKGVKTHTLRFEKVASAFDPPPPLDYLPLWNVNKTKHQVSVPDARIGAHSHTLIASPDAQFRYPTVGVDSRQQLPERLVLKPDPAPRHYV